MCWCLPNIAEDNGGLNVPDEDRSRYWDHYQEYMDRDYSEFLPLGVYGDDARYSAAGEKITLVTVNSLLTEPGRCWS